MTIVALLVAAPAHAQTVAPDSAIAATRFAEARAAFDAQDFSTALRLYEQCIALGMQGPAVHYNIGVAAYRIGEYARAERAFTEVAATPAMAALAHYNLGLVALKRGEKKAAREWFERAASEANDQTLADLARRRVTEMEAPAAARLWSLYGRAGAGFDDNVGLRSESIDTPGSGEDDTFAEALVAGSYAFRPAWRADAAVAMTRYTNVDDFDQMAVSLGATRAVALGSWYLDLGAHLTRLSLGGDVYEQSTAGAARASRVFSGVGTFRADLRLADVDGAGDYAGLTGSRANVGLHFEWTWRSIGFAARTRAESNDTRDPAYESRWVELDAEARWAASPRWGVAVGGSMRRTRHPTPVDATSWVDRRTTIRLEATRTLWRQAQLFVRCEHERNDSPFAAYDYERNWVAASIEVWR